jgi:hypothetical protein
MKKLILAAFGAALLVQAPAASARPMTATDLSTLTRLGAPDVSPDGNWAVFQLRETRRRGEQGPHRPLAARSSDPRCTAGADCVAAGA